jgi:hypothetical protein
VTHLMTHVTQGIPRFSHAGGGLALQHVMGALVWEYRPMFDGYCMARPLIHVLVLSGCARYLGNLTYLGVSLIAVRRFYDLYSERFSSL